MSGAGAYTLGTIVANDKTIQAALGLSLVVQARILGNILMKRRMQNVHHR